MGKPEENTFNQLEKIFENNFKKFMRNKDVEQFKKDYPTLYRVILESMNDAEQQGLIYYGAVVPIN